MEIINLTPHPLHLFAPDVPDRIELGDFEPIRILEPSGRIARMGTDTGDEFELDGLPVVRLEHTGPVCLPVYAGDMPDHERQVWYVVSLVVGLSAGVRDDLLAVEEAVRNRKGRVLGCRKFGKPTHRRIEML